MTALAMILRRPSIWLTALLCLAALGGFIAWSALAPLAEGVVAYGRVAGENDRKVVQHLEGGIVDQILVREGDIVSADQPLMVLASVAVSSDRDQVLQQLADAEASVDRLDALLLDLPALEFTRLEKVAVNEATRAEIETRQRSLYEQQLATLGANAEVLSSRRSSLLQRANAVEDQIDNTRRARELLVVDIARLRELVDLRMAVTRDLSELEVREAQLAADLARLVSEQQDARAQAGELSAQIRQTNAQFLEKLSEDLVKARADISSAEERLRAAQDVLNRTTVYAPQAGTVLNLAFSTPGGVVRPGESILEIVPVTPDLVATLQIRPSDRDAVFEGLAVEARLSGLNAWNSPLLKGEVDSISADLKTSPAGDYSYYEARVLIDSAGLAGLETDPMPGMPVEAFVSSGQTRTLFDYLLEPISAVIRRGARE
jgi:HlyD family type I secretion membrane fusion protein